MNNSGNPQMHDKRKNIAPAYSFGVKHKNFTNNHSPGPKFNIEGIWFHFIIFIVHFIHGQSLNVHGQSSGVHRQPENGNHQIEP